MKSVDKRIKKVQAMYDEKKMQKALEERTKLEQINQLNDWLSSLDLTDYELISILQRMGADWKTCKEKFEQIKGGKTNA